MRKERYFTTVRYARVWRLTSRSPYVGAGDFTHENNTTIRINVRCFIKVVLLFQIAGQRRVG